jgi:site-specific DNA-methyltransferase (adenine-specific)
VADFFAGSGTTGIAALDAHRQVLLVDNSPEAIDVIRARFKDRQDVSYEELAP